LTQVDGDHRPVGRELRIVGNSENEIGGFFNGQSARNGTTAYNYSYVFSRCPSEQNSDCNSGEKGGQFTDDNQGEQEMGGTGRGFAGDWLGKAREGRATHNEHTTYIDKRQMMQGSGPPIP
jgi:hypothetical protein